MRLLQRHIGRTVLGSIALIVLLMMGIETFVLFIQEVGDIGRGNYGIFQAFIFVLLQVPYQIYLFFPMASLLGSLLGLGMLASHSELTVMRAAGMSIGQIVRAVFRAALILILVVTAVGEFVIPQTVHHAQNRKAFEISGGQAYRTSQGIWVREGRAYLHINAVLPDERVAGVTRYQFDNQNRLTDEAYAATGVYKDGAWQVKNVSETQIAPDHISARKIPMAIWNISLSPSLLVSATQGPEEMSAASLYHFMGDRSNDITVTGPFALAFWKRLFQPIATCVMMLLAIPFIFGPLRSATMGSRFLAGASCGFGFYLLNQFFGPLSLVYQIPPILGAGCPILLFALAAMMLMRRVK